MSDNMNTATCVCVDVPRIWLVQKMHTPAGKEERLACEAYLHVKLVSTCNPVRNGACCKMHSRHLHAYFQKFVCALADPAKLAKGGPGRNR